MFVEFDHSVAHLLSMRDEPALEALGLSGFKLQSLGFRI